MNHLDPAKMQEAFKRNPEWQQNRIRILEVKVRRVEHLRAAALAQDQGNPAQSPVTKKSGARVGTLRVGITPNPPLRIGEQIAQSLHVNRNPAIRRWQGSEDSDFATHDVRPC